MSAVLVISGCDDPNGRQRISGTVSLDGQLLPDGEVSLRPFDTGPSAAGQIVDGKFVLTSEKGPPPGRYVVSIESNQSTGKKVTLPGTSLQMDETEQVVPEKYNTSSELVIEVKPGGDNHFELDLKAEQEPE